MITLDRNAAGHTAVCPWGSRPEARCNCGAPRKTYAVPPIATARIVSNPAHVSPLCVCGQPLSAHAVCGQYDGGCWESGCDEFRARPRVMIRAEDRPLQPFEVALARTFCIGLTWGGMQSSAAPTDGEQRLMAIGDALMEAGLADENYKGAKLIGVGGGAVEIAFGDGSVFLPVASQDEERALGECMYQPVAVTISTGDAGAARDKAWARLVKSYAVDLDKYPPAEHDALEAEHAAAMQALRDLGMDVDQLLEDE